MLWLEAQGSASTDTSSSAMASAWGAARPPWGCRRVTPAAVTMSGTTPAQTAHGVDSREGAVRSQASFDGNLLRCPVLKSFGRYVRTSLFFRNVSVPTSVFLTEEMFQHKSFDQIHRGAQSVKRPPQQSVYRI